MKLNLDFTERLSDYVAEYGEPGGGVHFMTPKQPLPWARGRRHVFERLDGDWFPPSMRRTVEARNIANISGRCPICGSVATIKKPPPAPPRKRKRDSSPRDRVGHMSMFHEYECPASDANVKGTLTELMDQAPETPVILDLRLDPQHAREAGCIVDFTPISTVCDFCCGPVEHRESLRPMPQVMFGARRILYFNAEWTFCQKCWEVRSDGDALTERQLSNQELTTLMDSFPESMTFLAATAVSATVGYERAQQPYREKLDALNRLVESRMAILRSVEGDMRGLRHG